MTTRPTSKTPAVKKGHPMRPNSVLLALLFAVLACGHAFAQKTKPPAPPAVVEPGSSVFFKLSSTGDVYQMDDNGQNLRVVVANADFRTLAPNWTYDDAAELSPSSRTYDGQHWWVWCGYREDSGLMPDGSPIIEIFVGVPGSWATRLTNLWDDWGVYPAGRPEVTWSSDGNDSFISFVGYDYNDPTPRAPSIYKIPFAATIDGAGDAVPVAAWDPGDPNNPNDPIPPTPTAIAAEIPLPGFNSAAPSAPYWTNFDLHTWTRDGQKLLYAAVRNDGNSYRVRLHRDVDPAQGPELVWENDRLNGLWPAALNAKFSPDSSTIAFARFRSTYERDILTIGAGSTGLYGTAATTPILTGRYRGYSYPTWSPSGANLIAQEVDASKGIDVSKFPRNLVRITATGGSFVRLPNNLTTTANKLPLGWRNGKDWMAP